MGEVNQLILVARGAEASLYVTDWHCRKAIVKRRRPKRYRSSQLDKKIRTYRTIHEPQLVHEAKEAGVPTPTILLVDTHDTRIVMSFIEGRQVKRLLGKLPRKDRWDLCVEIGRSIGKLHEHNIIHGDLTTSNMICGQGGKIYFLDFGLAEKSKELESRGVDLHLMKRALQSTHFRLAGECFDAVVKGYSEETGQENAERVLEKVEEIEGRGRYVAERITRK